MRYKYDRSEDGDNLDLVLIDMFSCLGHCYQGLTMKGDVRTSFTGACVSTHHADIVPV